jgi:NAD(P)-dependent dehydrogenase (short-subunit alcohol dehydrogenase family)
MTMFELKGRVAVVTGAASGIGRATAVHLAEKGCHVALVDVDEAGLREAAREAAGHGVEASEHVVDVSLREAMARLPEQVVERHGAVHVLVNNAGVACDASFENASLEQVDRVVDVNIWGVVHGCKFFLPYLRRAGRAGIANVASLYALTGIPLQTAYTMSKFAVRGFSESLRVELAGTGIGVTCVYPGGYATNIVTSAYLEPADGLDSWRARNVARYPHFRDPRHAARRIVRGIERDQPRVLLGLETRLVDAIARLAPEVTADVYGATWRRTMPTDWQRRMREAER